MPLFFELKENEYQELRESLDSIEREIMKNKSLYLQVTSNHKKSGDFLNFDDIIGLTTRDSEETAEPADNLKKRNKIKNKLVHPKKKQRY